MKLKIEQGIPIPQRDIGETGIQNGFTHHLRKMNVGDSMALGDYSPQNARVLVRRLSPMQFLIRRDASRAYRVWRTA
jgi:hypothetical protein